MSALDEFQKWLWYQRGEGYGSRPAVYTNGPHVRRPIECRDTPLDRVLLALRHSDPEALSLDDLTQSCANLSPDDIAAELSTMAARGLAWSERQDGTVRWSLSDLGRLATDPVIDPSLELARAVRSNSR